MAVGHWPGGDARTPPRMCPFCGYVTDAASGLQAEHHGAVPEPGDWAVCLKCGEAAVYADGLALRKPALGEREALRLEDPEADRMLARASALAREQRRAMPIPERGGRA